MSCRNMSMLLMIILSASYCTLEAWTPPRLSSVTNFEGIHEYYRYSRDHKMSPPEPSNPKDRARVKKESCKYIFESHFFKIRGLVWVDSEKIREYLRENDSDAFHALYEEYQYENRFPPSNTSYGYDYKNKYTLKRVRIDADEVDGHVLTCFAKDRSSGRMKKYFISRWYDTSTFARFVFSAEEDDGLLIIIALAEEAAIERDVIRKTTSKLMPIYYTFIRWNQKLASEPALDPLCSLGSSEKLRLCSALFSSSVLKNKIKYEPIVDNIDYDDCVKKTVKIMFVQSRIFQEWVIGCKALSVRTKKPVIYYVSRADEENEIFVYREAGQSGMLHVYNWFDNLGMVGEYSGADNDDSDEEEANEGGNRVEHGERLLQMGVED